MSFLPLCSRCLVNDAQVDIVALLPDGRIRTCDVAADPVRLRAWAEEAFSEQARFVTDDTTDRFRPVSSWHGDPVCGFHLRECRARELSPRRWRRLAVPRETRR